MLGEAKATARWALNRVRLEARPGRGIYLPATPPRVVGGGRLTLADEGNRCPGVDCYGATVRGRPGPPPQRVRMDPAEGSIRFMYAPHMSWIVSPRYGQSNSPTSLYYALNIPW